MRAITRSEIHPFKMHNPPKEIIDASFRVINLHDGFVYTYVGRGWIKGEKATKKDHKNIPQLID